jgi:XTP/dITP diphosphohydrolase
MTMHNLSNEILIATRNAGKLREMRELLAPTRWRLHSLLEFPSTEEVEETGETFIENAILKAQAYSAATGLWTIADDSGLEVEALGGAPGVYSARYAGAGATDSARIQRLLKELSKINDQERRARFVSAIAIADPNAVVHNIAQGYCEGSIAHAAKGNGGFGYDPVFIPNGYTQSFGELSETIKQKISHRAQALEQARAFLLAHLQTSA